jgi:hypothetical protein
LLDGICGKVRDHVLVPIPNIAVNMHGLNIG